MKYILSVIDSHGDTWLYPFESFHRAEEARAALEQVALDADADHNGGTLVLEVIESETPRDAFQIKDDWTERLFVTRCRSVARQIKKWNRVNVEHLRRLVSEFQDLQTIAENDGEPFEGRDYGIDWSSLPSADLPKDLDTSYPVWAMDEAGRCLVGDGLNQIEHLTEVQGASQ